MEGMLLVSFVEVTEFYISLFYVWEKTLKLPFYVGLFHATDRREGGLQTHS